MGGLTQTITIGDGNHMVVMHLHLTQRNSWKLCYWRWKPHGCDAPPLDPKKFLEAMRGKTFVFIGDSILRNHSQSMVMYILDQVRALEEEILLRIKQQGHTELLRSLWLIPDAKGTKCNQELKQISDTKHFQHPSCAIQDRERSCSEELDISF